MGPASLPRAELTGFPTAVPLPLPARLCQTGLQLLVFSGRQPVTHSLGNDILGMLPAPNRRYLECGVEPFVVENDGHTLGHTAP